MATNKKNNKFIIIILVAMLVVAAIFVGIKIYQSVNSQVYSGDGMYYHQDGNTFLQFSKDNTFSFTEQTDENTSDVLKGKWSEKGDEIILTFESGSEFTFVKTEDGYLYRKDIVYHGKTSDKKLLNNEYALEKDGEKVETLYFMDDSTVEVVQGHTVTSRGTYTRVDNILIVRRTTIPDSFGKRIELVERYLVLENGITKEIFSKTPFENVAK